MKGAVEEAVPTAGPPEAVADLGLEDRNGLQLLFLLEDLLLHLIDLVLLGHQGLFSSSQLTLHLVQQLFLHHLTLWNKPQRVTQEFRHSFGAVAHKKTYSFSLKLF